MSRVLVCIPVPAEGTAGHLAGPVQGFSANASLREVLGIAEPEPGSSAKAADELREEAEYGALVIASVWGLTQFGVRLVVTAEVDSAQISAGEEPEHGGVLVSDVGSQQVIAVFGDDDETAAAQAAGQVRGDSIDQAWANAAVADLLTHELLWFTPSERGL